jgi:hypothetical protein
MTLTLMHNKIQSILLTMLTWGCSSSTLLSSEHGWWCETLFLN